MIVASGERGVHAKGHPVSCFDVKAVIFVQYDGCRIHQVQPDQYEDGGRTAA